MPKATTPTSVRQGRRHNPLEDDLIATGPLRAKAPKRKSKNAEEEEQEGYIDSKASKKILKIGRELAEEIDVSPPRPPTESNAFGFDSRFDDEEGAFDDEEVWGDEDEIVEEIEIEPEDLDTFNRFLPTDDDPLLTHGWGGQVSAEEQGPGTNLADLILARIAQHEAGQDGEQELAPVDEDYELSPKVVEVYTKYVVQPVDNIGACTNWCIGSA